MAPEPQPDQAAGQDQEGLAVDPLAPGQGRDEAPHADSPSVCRSSGSRPGEQGLVDLGEEAGEEARTRLVRPGELTDHVQLVQGTGAGELPARAVRRLPRPVGRPRPVDAQRVKMRTMFASTAIGTALRKIRPRSSGGRVLSRVSAADRAKKVTSMLGPLHASITPMRTPPPRSMTLPSAKAAKPSACRA